MPSDNPTGDPAAFPAAREAPLNPPGIYASWRAAQELPRVRLSNGRDSLVVTRYADVKEMLSRRDSSALTANRFAPGFPGLPKGITGVSADANILFMDEPAHGVIRRMLFSSFTAKAVASMRPGIQGCVDGVLDAVIASGSPLDLHQAFSLPVPSLIICQLLGVPYADHTLFQEMTQQILSRNVDSGVFDDAMHRMHAYMDQVVSSKAKHPSADDMLGRLIVEHGQRGEISHDQIVGLGVLMLIAGHETTSNSLSLGAVHLLTDARTRSAVTDSPDLMRAFVDEAVRIDSIADFVPARLAVTDTAIGSCPVAAGDGVIALTGAANHDPAAFPNPLTVDLHRDNRQHMGFGFGVHACIGQHLARAEMEISYATLLRRLPGIRLAVAAEDLEFRHDGMVYGLRQLPVTW